MKRKTWGVPRIAHPQHPGIMLRITELAKGGPLYVVRMVGGKQEMASLRCTRKDFGTDAKEQERQARARAFEIIEALATGKPLPTSIYGERATGEILTLGTLADLYEKDGVHGRTEKYKVEQVAKLRRVVAIIGAERSVASLSRSDVDLFCTRRRAEKKDLRPNTLAGDIDG